MCPILPPNHDMLHRFRCKYTLKRIYIIACKSNTWRLMETNLEKSEFLKKILPVCRFTPKLGTQRGPFVYTNVYNFKYFYASNGNPWPGFDVHKK